MSIFSKVKVSTAPTATVLQRKSAYKHFYAAWNTSGVTFDLSDWWPAGWTTEIQKVETTAAAGYSATNIKYSGSSITFRGAGCYNCVVYAKNKSGTVTGRDFSFQIDSVRVADTYESDNVAIAAGDSFKASDVITSFLNYVNGDGSYIWLNSKNDGAIASPYTTYNDQRFTTAKFRVTSSNEDVVKFSQQVGDEITLTGVGSGTSYVNVGVILPQSGSSTNWLLAYNVDFTVTVEESTDPESASITAGTSSKTITVGDTFKASDYFFYTTTGGDGKVYLYFNTTSSSIASIADQKGHGTVTGVSAGTCYVTATLVATTTGNTVATARFSLTVQAKSEPTPTPTPTPTFTASIKANSPYSIETGEKAALSKLFTVTASSSGYTLSCTASGNASVSGSNLVAGEPGKATVKASVVYSGTTYATATCTVKVLGKWLIAIDDHEWKTSEDLIYAGSEVVTAVYIAADGELRQVYPNEVVD